MSTLMAVWSYKYIQEVWYIHIHTMTLIYPLLLTALKQNWCSPDWLVSGVQVMLE